MKGRIFCTLSLSLFVALHADYFSLNLTLDVILSTQYTVGVKIG